LIIGILFANEEKSCTFALTVSATLPVEQRTRAELLPLYYEIFGNNSEPQGNLFFHHKKRQVLQSFCLNLRSLVDSTRL
jgi:hypothetical protein